MKLKPCPFCGSEVKVYRNPHSHYTSDYWHVTCTTDRCHGGIYDVEFNYTKEEAIEAWNKRSESAWEMFRRLEKIECITFHKKLREKCKIRFSKGKDIFYGFIRNYTEEEAIAIMQEKKLEDK